MARCNGLHDGVRRTWFVRGFGFALLVFTVVLVSAAPAASANASPAPVYRFYNRVTATDYYTTSTYTKARLSTWWARRTWTYYGVPFSIDQALPLNSTPLYHLRSRSTGAHVYTTSASDWTRLRSAGYVDYGIAFRVCTRSDVSATPVYRFLRAKGGHYFTSSLATRDHLIRYHSGTLRYRGIAFYIATQYPDTTPPQIQVASSAATVTAGSSFEVTATISDASSVTATLYARPVGSASYTAIPMPGSLGVYSAAIPASMLTGPCEYYVRAVDAAGNAATLPALAPASVMLVTPVEDVVVEPRRFSGLEISAPATATVGASFRVTVTALDQYGDVFADFEGPVTLAALEGSGTLTPSSITTFAEGQGSIDTRYSAPGIVTLRATSGSLSATRRLRVDAAPKFGDATTLSDGAQRATIAFDGLAFLTGSLGADSFFPPGKVADFWGFQYLRDNDPSEMGHNTDFLTRASLNTLYALNSSQRSQLIALARQQTTMIDQYGYDRFVLMTANRRLLEGDMPTGAVGLDAAAYRDFSADLYELDGTISLQRALVMGSIIRSLSETQTAYLDHMVARGMTSWPVVGEPAEMRSLSVDEKTAVMTYAGDIYSWYAGSLTADVYFCPERQGTYFGSFYMKDAPAVNNPGYSIPTTATAELGTAFLRVLTPSQAALVTGLVDSQRADLERIIEVRRAISLEMRTSLSGGAPDTDTVKALMREYGELDGAISVSYATAFTKVDATLSDAQRAKLVELRKSLLGNFTPSAAFLYSEVIPFPTVRNTDFLFGATPTFAVTEIAGRPTASSVTINTVPQTSVPFYYEYGTTSSYGSRTASQAPDASTKGDETTITGLSPSTRYYYRLRSAGYVGPQRTFVTQRAEGASFTFEVQGDSHPERVNTQFNSTLYSKVMASAKADNPDFFVCLGDDFSVDTVPTSTISAQVVDNIYLNQRRYLGGIDAPVFLVNGNHEQASLANLDGTPNNVAVWAQTARNGFYPQPAPDGFYTGDAEQQPFIGKLRDYYAFTWGDALFVMIDPYWHSTQTVDNPYGTDKDAARDLWNNTLGDEQYAWFKQTLESSDAKYKFVFAHHVLGTGRGGVEWAGRYEWGDTANYPAKRPAWTKTIHQIMVENGVDVFFQGHDHIYAKQELDGVIYQTLPEPADPNYTLWNSDYFLSGEKLPDSGRLRVTVGTDDAKVEYVRSYLEKADEVAASYTLVDSPTIPGAGVLAANELLGRPTDSSVALSTVLTSTAQFSVQYGTSSGSYGATTASQTPAPNEPNTTEITGLSANTRYYYRVRQGLATGVEHSFVTQRSRDATFTFTIDADPHNGEPSFNGPLLAKTFMNALADRPDFNVDLGDTFMTEKLQATTLAQSKATYRAMRPYFQAIGADAPVFLVNGNHEGELGWLYSSPAYSGLPTWCTALRQSYFPSPSPGGFYSGATSTDARLGAKRDGYYAWEWGDALFIALDPYWYTTSKPVTGMTDDNWDMTLGKEQYDWLKSTLETSDATYRFVFVHSLVGGGAEARGGTEVSQYFEWGGKNLDGSDGFAAHRPGWAMPIHDLLVANKVNAVFHGHDHVFVKQERDGIVYQETPQPDNAQYSAATAAEYGYVGGTVLPNSGHLRVSVGPTASKVDYVRSVLPQDERVDRRNGQVDCTYNLLPR